MSWHNKVVWTEGMFLQPQHFQQHDRFLANQMQAKVASMSPYHWGFADLQIDEAALAMGKLALVSARGVLPDGTAFSMPIEDAVPAAVQQDDLHPRVGICLCNQSGQACPHVQ